MKYRVAQVTFLLFTLVAPVMSAQDTDVLLSDTQPRNVILIIGDGMDDHQLTIARNYLKGPQGTLLLDTLPVRGVSQILTVQDDDAETPVFVADSANTATSMATGVVTSRGRIATAAGTDKPLPSIIDELELAGFRTGLVTTSSVTDATPSAFVAKINFRLCENPSLMEEVTFYGLNLGSCKQHMKSSGGRGSIAEQLAASSVDVILGGGTEHFDMPAEEGGLSVKDQAQANGFQWLTTAEQLAAAGNDKRLLGLFSSGTMPVRLRGENGREAEEPSPSLLNRISDYLGDVELPEPMVCEPNPEYASVPSLKRMTDAALSHLAAGNSRGFFLMIESASIDKQSHERKPCGSIGEVEQLDEALQSALDFAKQQPRTLIIVTADHSQAAQLVSFDSMFKDYTIPAYTPGKVARIRTPQGHELAVNYATSNFFMEEHTGAQVPLYANSEGVKLIPNYLHQPQIYHITRQYLGLPTK